MAAPTAGSGHDQFPPIPDPSNEETKEAELYPKNLQDDINESYGHNKVLPRKAGTDYVDDKASAAPKDGEGY